MIPIITVLLEFRSVFIQLRSISNSASDFSQGQLGKLILIQSVRLVLKIMKSVTPNTYWSRLLCSELGLRASHTSSRAAETCSCMTSLMMLFVFAMLICYQCYTVNGLATDPTTTISPGPTPGAVCSTAPALTFDYCPCTERQLSFSCDNYRTVWSIVQSCLVSILACTWVAVHRNIPGPKQSWTSVQMESIKVFMLTILVPEWIFGWAVRQFLIARKVATELEEARVRAQPQVSASDGAQIGSQSGHEEINGTELMERGQSSARSDGDRSGDNPDGADEQPGTDESEYSAILNYTVTPTTCSSMDHHTRLLHHNGWISRLRWRQTTLSFGPSSSGCKGHTGGNCPTHLGGNQGQEQSR